MTELQLTPAQHASSHFLRQLFAIDAVQLYDLKSDRVCTNLSGEQLGGLACQPASVALAQSEQDWLSVKLVVRAQALSLEKIHAIQDALAEHLHVKALRMVSPGGQTKILQGEEFGVVLEAKCSPQGVPADCLETLSRRHQLELNLLKSSPSLSKPGLLVMDMDSTVIAMECIDELAKLAGAGEEVAAVTELAMQGKLDFVQSLRQRVSCLAGADVSILESVRTAMPLMPGLEKMLLTLKAKGWKVVLVSGGFTIFAEHLKQRLGLDHVFANTLEIEDGKLTGRVLGDVVDGKAKADTLVRLAQEYEIAKAQTIAMGDGANDLLMMSQAGLGVAFHAKPVVLAKADAAIRFGGLDELLYLLEA
ncbi:phosphoserine phosphatase SerB [Aliiglaciecola sp. CAU 1673]|uniref:phosphoserine phosphatase SerB n=1 Tax=Aliiglaciecola sp. CAU 1673 TaxID=3032595 RepID=UPI0023DA5A37|nr:phosphoserine phosphatase SerB [Aliiglaciecola sp. CAU 1673]MDF2178006.1 phosphoserine phosphatase SerB [Aliiglaciecola sp. CAU 1673]